MRWRRDAGYGTLDADNTATGHGAGSGGCVASGLLGFGKIGVQGPSAWEERTDGKITSQDGQTIRVVRRLANSSRKVHGPFQDVYPRNG